MISDLPTYYSLLSNASQISRQNVHHNFFSSQCHFDKWCGFYCWPHRYWITCQFQWAQTNVNWYHRLIYELLVIEFPNENYWTRFSHSFVILFLRFWICYSSLKTIQWKLRFKLIYYQPTSVFRTYSHYCNTNIIAIERMSMSRPK